MTATNKPMTGAQLNELMAVAMRMQSDSEKMGERSFSMFAYAVQIAVLEIRETRCKYEELKSQNAELSVHLANAESKCRELASRNAEPVFFIEVDGDDWIQAGRIPGSTFDFNNLPDGIIKLYATPQPAPDSEAQATLKRLAVILHGSETDLNLLTVTAQSLMDRCRAGYSPVTTE
ncbi:hypothetical protein ABNU38_09475 [Citrobacter braakii]|uniref:hypothetical protein n=1 Tax=Citrobacter braakii TaxID=57706 RepID=UPI00339D1688